MMHECKLLRLCMLLLLHKAPSPCSCSFLTQSLHLVCRLKDRIEEVLKTDRTMRLMVQLEAALHDSRIEASCVSACTQTLFALCSLTHCANVPCRKLLN